MSDTFDALFDQFQFTAYRLEAMPSYAVSTEDALYRSFVDGTSRPERSVRTSPWMRRIAVTTARGKTWSRTRVIDSPLTEYQRFQMPAYQESQVVGEGITLVDRADAGEVGPDFWLFDTDHSGACAAVMQYSTDGTPGGFDLVRDPDVLAELRTVRRRLDEIAVPLADYLATTGGPRG